MDNTDANTATARYISIRMPTKFSLCHDCVSPSVHTTAYLEILTVFDNICMHSAVNRYATKDHKKPMENFNR